MSKVVINKKKLAELEFSVKSLIKWDKIKENYLTIVSRKGWNPFKDKELFLEKISSLREIIQLIVTAVEKASNKIAEGVSSAEKLKTASKIIDEIITFPFIIELFDNFIFYILISLAVDSLNRFLGKNWIKKLKT